MAQHARVLLRQSDPAAAALAAPAAELVGEDVDGGDGVGACVVAQRGAVGLALTEDPRGAEGGEQVVAAGADRPPHARDPVAHEEQDHQQPEDA